jgi:EAL domain-containing protein (putative c-di-GMP-specific phosphodiesterase class I)
MRVATPSIRELDLSIPEVWVPTPSRADDPAADPELAPVLARAAAGVAHLLDLTYLPQIDLASGEVVGVDVNLRVAHPRRGLLAPARFWPAAGAAGLLSPLARQAVRRCVREVPASDHGPGADLRVWLPLPSVLVHDPSLLALVEELATELAPRALVLQFGEDWLDTAGDRAVGPAALQGAGAAVAVLTDGEHRWRDRLEDGLGVDALRLSPRLVRAVADPVRDGAEGAEGDVTAATAGVIECAHRHGLVVAATAVESWDVSAGLWELGCDRASGYLFSPPLTGERVNGLLRGHASWLGRDDAVAMIPRPRPVPLQ